MPSESAANGEHVGAHLLKSDFINALWVKIIVQTSKDLWLVGSVHGCTQALVLTQDRLGPPVPTHSAGTVVFGSLF